MKHTSIRKGKPQDLLRQKKLASLLLEDTGKTPIGKLMLKAGYSKAYSKNPQDLKMTLSWQDLMERNLPDDLLARKHNELLQAMVIDHYVFPNTVSDKDVGEIITKTPGCRLIKIQRNFQWAYAYFSVPDNRSRKDAIDMAYRLKSRYPKGQQGEDHELTIHIKND